MTDQRTAERRAATSGFGIPNAGPDSIGEHPPASSAGTATTRPCIAVVLVGVVLLNLADYLLTVRALDRGRQLRSIP